MSSWSRSAGYGRRQPPLSDILLSTICQNSTGVQKLREHYNQILATQNDSIFDSPLTPSDGDDGSSDGDRDVHSSKLIEVIDYPETFAHAAGDGDQSHNFYAHTRARNGDRMEHWEGEIAVRRTKIRARVEQILDRCLYLYSKRGLDLHSLIAELQAEEAELKASEKEFRDQCYQISKQQQQAETIYFGDPRDPADVRDSLDGVQQEFLELPPIDQPPNTAVTNASNGKRKTTKMGELLAEREANMAAEAAMAMLAEQEYEFEQQRERLKLGQDWMIDSDSWVGGSGGCGSKLSPFAQELVTASRPTSRARPPSGVPLTAAETFCKLLDSQFGQ